MFNRNIIVAVIALLLVSACGRPADTGAPATAVATRPQLPPLSHNDSLRFKLYYFEAVKQQIEGNYDAAYDLYSHCRDINPNAAEAWFMLSLYDAMLGNDSTAMADLKTAADLAPDNDDYLERLATGYLKVGAADDAVKAYERLAANSPERADILDILTQLYDRKKDYEGMLRTVGRIEALEGSSEQIALAKMRVYALQGKKSEELAVLHDLQKQHPGDMNYRVMTGNWLLQNGRPDDAYREYSYALKEEPDNAMARMSMLDYYRSTGNAAKADSIQTDMLISPKTPVDSKMTMMRRVVAENEKNGADSTKVLSLFRRIMAVRQETTDMAELYVGYLTLKRMPQDSIDNVLESILRQSPDNTGARMQLIQSEWNRKRFDRVEELSRQAIDYNADVPAFHYFLGMALVQQDRDGDALDAFRRCVSLDRAADNKDLMSDCYAIMGDILHDRGSEREAYAAYDSCLQLKDDNFGCLNNYAYYLSLKGERLDQAEQMSYRTVQAEPDNSTYLDTYAWILFRRKKYAEAAEYIDMAVSNDTTKSAVLLEHAGDIHAMNGETDTAVKYWRQALELDGTNNKTLIRKIKLKKYIDEK